MTLRALAIQLTSHLVIYAVGYRDLKVKDTHPHFSVDGSPGRDEPVHHCRVAALRQRSGSVLRVCGGREGGNLKFDAFVFLMMDNML